MLTHTADSSSLTFAHAARVVIKRAAASVRAHVADICTYLAQSSEERQRAREEAYLAEAVDRYDLEFRMRELDRGRTSQSQWRTGSTD